MSGTRLKSLKAQQKKGCSWLRYMKCKSFKSPAWLFLLKSGVDFHLKIQFITGYIFTPTCQIFQK